MGKKISIILPDLSGGGAEKMSIDLGARFIELGYTVDLVLVQKKGRLLSMVPDAFNIVDLQASKLRHGLFPLVKYFRRSKPDAIIASMWPLTIITAWAKLISGTESTLILTEHTTFSLSPIYKKKLHHIIMPLTMRFSYPLANAVVGVSNGVVQDLKELSKNKRTNFKTIYNPAYPDSDVLKSTKPNGSFWYQKKSKKIISIGSLKKAKDYPT